MSEQTDADNSTALMIHQSDLVVPFLSNSTGGHCYYWLEDLTCCKKFKGKTSGLNKCDGLLHIRSSI